MGVKTFWLSDSPLVERSLRRYVNGATGLTCPGPFGYHNAEVVIERFEKAPGPDRYETLAAYPAQFEGDPRWPRKCDGCGYVFHRDDEWQVNEHRLMQGCPDGQLYTLHDAPPGAMWDAWWMGSWRTGPDGIHLMVKCPNGWDWAVDGPASNCDKPGDHEHRCWTRAGDPRTGVVTVGKQFGPTCGAGAGSILAGNYHGFLRNGEFTPNM